MNVTFSVDVPDLDKRAFKARNDRGFTQEEASRLSGLSVKTIQAIEQGKRGLTEESLNRLCKAYKISVKKFLSGVDFFNTSSYT